MTEHPELRLTASIEAVHHEFIGAISAVRQEFTASRAAGRLEHAESAASIRQDRGPAGEEDRCARTAAMVRLGGMIAITVAILAAIIKL